MSYCSAHLARIIPPLAAAALVSCAADRGVERRSAEPTLLPFTYAAQPDGAFNGGVRAILQDRDGNYWFGSHFEGVCRVDGEQVRGFTTADGLSSNQVRSVQEAPDGTSPPSPLQEKLCKMRRPSGVEQRLRPFPLQARWHPTLTTRLLLSFKGRSTAASSSAGTRRAPEVTGSSSGASRG